MRTGVNAMAAPTTARAVVCVGVLAAGLAAPLASATSAAAADTAFVHVETAAAAVLMSSAQHPGLTPFSSEVVDDATAYTASVLDSGGGSQAQAAAIYPGALVVQGPALLCQEIVPQYFGTDCPFTPPDYPLLADASYPTHPHDAAAAGGQPVGGSGLPLTLVPGRAEATAAERGNDATTSTTAVDLLAGTPAAMTIGSAVSSTTSHATEGTVTVRVESVLHDVTIAGAVHVAVIDAVDEITAAPGTRPVDRPHVTVGGVTVAGQAATIDEAGVHVAGQDGPAPPQPLRQQGVSVRLVGVDRSDHPGVARSTATGLLVTAAVPVQGVPSVPNPVGCPPDPFPCPPDPSNLNATYLVDLTLGSVGALATAQPGFSFALGTPLLTPPGNGVLGVRDSAPVAAAASPTSAGAGTPAAAAPRMGPPVRPRWLLAGFLHVPLDALYAVLALVTASVFVGWRAVVTLAAGRRR